MAVYIDTPLFVITIAGTSYLKLMHSLTDGFEIIASLDEAKAQAHSEVEQTHQHRYVVSVWDETIHGYVITAPSEFHSYFLGKENAIVYRIKA